MGWFVTNGFHRINQIWLSTAGLITQAGYQRVARREAELLLQKREALWTDQWSQLKSSTLATIYAPTSFHTWAVLSPEITLHVLSTATVGVLRIKESESRNSLKVYAALTDGDFPANPTDPRKMGSAPHFPNIAISKSFPFSRWEFQLFYWAKIAPGERTSTWTEWIYSPLNRMKSLVCLDTGSVSYCY